MKKSLLAILLAALLSSCSNKSLTNDSIKPIITIEDTYQLFGNDYIIDDQHSYLGFKIKYFGHSPVRGRFDRFKGTVFYDTASGFLSVQLRVHVNSINTGNERRDNDLSKEGWFEAEQYPFITFASSEIMKDDPSGFTMKGDLVIKDVTKNVSIKFDKPTSITRDWAGNEQVDYHGSLIINRREFGVEGGGFWNTVMEDGLMQLSDEVEIEIDMHTRRPDYNRRKDAKIIDSLAIILLERLDKSDTTRTLVLTDSMMRADNNFKWYVLADLGSVLLKQGRYREAISVFRKEARLFPDEKSVYNDLAISCLLVHDEATARKWFERSLREDSLDLQASEYLRIMELNEQ